MVATVQPLVEAARPRDRGIMGTTTRAAALLVLLALAFAACRSQQDFAMFSLDHLNPAGMHRNPAFSQAVVVRGAHETLYIGGQNAVDGEGKIVGVGDIAAQATQVASNLRTVLAAAGASPDHVVKWNVHLVQGQAAGLAMRAFQQHFGVQANPAAITVSFVAGLAHPEFLLEVDAIAVVPE